MHIYFVSFRFIDGVLVDRPGVCFETVDDGRAREIAAAILAGRQFLSSGNPEIEVILERRTALMSYEPVGRCRIQRIGQNTREVSWRT